jgi:ABC-type nickel/cobalt efflux system permease component RcnA
VTATLRKYYPWVIFLGFLLLLLFSSTSWAKTMDWLLWPLRFGIIAGFSILLIWSRWRHRNDERAEGRSAHKDSADHFLASVRRWYHGVQKR